MSNHYRKIVTATNYAQPLMDAIDFFESELEKASLELKAKGRIEDIQKRIPGIVELRFNQLQELEAILKFLEIEFEKSRGSAYRKYMEGYARALTGREAERYADCEPDVINIRLLINEIARVRNKYLGISKGLEYLHFQLSSIVRLRIAGMEDATL